MRTKTRLSILAILLIAMFAIVPAVSAHPLGNFSINHFARIRVDAHQIRVETVLDMAEIPAFQEISLLDKDQNGKAGLQETAGYPERQCQDMLGQLSLQQNGNSVPLTLGRSAVSFPPGAGGLATLRLTCSFQSGALQIRQDDRVDFKDQSYADRIGWREIVVSADGIPLSGKFETSSISKALTAYPQDMLSSPLDIRQVSLRVGPGAAVGNAALAESSAAGAPQKTGAPSIGGRSDRFTELITLQDLTPTGLAMALAIAFIWGGLHSLTPGHGKTIVAAYLVGSRGTARHAVYLGLVTTATHTAGVFLLGLITYFASRYIVPEQLFPWISILSGVLVVMIGVSLFIGRLRKATRMEKKLAELEQPRVKTFSLSGKWAGSPPSKSGLILQSPAHNLGRSAIWAAPPHHHAGGVLHKHGAEGIPHTHGPGSRPHSHMPPGADGGSVSFRSLLGLGISGGLLPCPSALVVLLGAIALNRIGLGVLLVLAFSIGLAAVLTGIGLILVYARRFFDHLPVHSRFTGLIPAGSALFITILGIGITMQAFAQLGY